MSYQVIGNYRWILFIGAPCMYVWERCMPHSHEAAATVTICVGALESILRFMAP